MKDLANSVSGNHAKKEVKMDAGFVQDIIKKEGYGSITSDLNIGNIKDIGFLQTKFSSHMDLMRFNEVEKEKQHLITGFGPTNSPTGGTLSVILRALLFEKETGIDSTIIISNLGAFNSRNINLEKIDYLTHRFTRFIRSLGYKGELRTHNNFNMLVASSLTAKVLSIKDFIDNEEVTTDLYKQLKIQGEAFPTYNDMNYTVADIVLPTILNKKERVLVFVGIEEHYFPKLANEVLGRFDEKYPSQFSTPKAHISAIFSNLIGGLNGYPKMSKSIPDSSINLNDSYEDLERKIVHPRIEDEAIILQMMTLVSDWEPKKINMCLEAFREQNDLWNHLKKEYLEYFVNIKKLWDETEDKNYHFDVRTLFEQHNV